MTEMKKWSQPSVTELDILLTRANKIGFTWDRITCADDDDPIVGSIIPGEKRKLAN